MPDLVLLIGGMAFVTYIPRALPLLLLSSRKLPPVVGRWLELIPPAVLSALLLPALVLGKREGLPVLDISLDNAFLLAALPTIMAWFATRSFFGTVAAGMACVASLRFFFGYV